MNANRGMRIITSRDIYRCNAHDSIRKLRSFSSSRTKRQVNALSLCRNLPPNTRFDILICYHRMSQHGVDFNRTFTVSIPLWWYAFHSDAIKEIGYKYKHCNHKNKIILIENLQNIVNLPKIVLG